MVHMNTNTQFAKSEIGAGIMLAPLPAIDPEQAWRQVVGRDAAAGFFYAVPTTGVVCRPACKSRRPLRSNVRFFRSVAEAQASGFRPCLRCRPIATAWGNPLEK